MADKDVKIHIGTEADTKGAQEAQDALNRVKDAAAGIAPASPEPQSIVPPSIIEEADATAAALDDLTDSAKDTDDALRPSTPSTIVPSTLLDEATAAGISLEDLTDAAEEADKALHPSTPPTIIPANLVPDARRAEGALRDVSDTADKVTDALSPMEMPGHLLGPERVDEFEEAEAALEGVADAASDVAESITDAGEAMRRGNQQQKDHSASADRTKRSVNELAEAQGKLATNTQAAGEATRKTTEEINRTTTAISRRQIAQGVALASRELSSVVETLRDLSTAAKGADDEASQTLTGLADGLEHFQSAVSGAATGFAVGGPWGAIVGGITGLAAPGLKTAFDDLVGSLNNLAEAKAIQAGMPARIEAIKKALDMKQATESWRELKQVMREVYDEVEAEQQIQRAQRDARQFAAEQGLRIAEVTGEKLPEAKAELRAVMEQNAVQELAAGIAAAMNKVFESQGNLDAARAGLEVARRSGSVQDVEKAEREVEEFTESLRKANLELRTTRELANIQQGSNELKSVADDIEIRKQLEDAEKTAGSRIADALEGILSGLGDEVANSVNIQGAAERLREILKDGFQSEEYDEIFQLMNTIVGQSRQGWQEQRIMFQQFLDIVKNGNTLVNAVASQLNEVKEEQRTIKNRMRLNGAYPNH